jgi:DNA-binding transcriptional LysR family regulator
MDTLDAMRVFTAVANAGSFSAAARQLRLSPSVVTRAVIQLEERLGVAVLARTTRSVRVTERGTRYLDHCRRILDDVSTAEAQTRGQDAALRGELTVAAPMTFGRLHVLPIVQSLLADHPELAVRLLLSDRNAHLVDDGIDIAVRIGDLADSAAIATALGSVRPILVASKRYLAAHPAPRSPRELAVHSQPRSPRDGTAQPAARSRRVPGRHDLIAFESLDRTNEWRFKSETVRVRPRLTVTTADAAVAAAEADMGIARVVSYQATEALSAGRIVEVLPTHAPAAVPVSAMYLERRAATGAVSAFLAAARVRLQRHPIR